MSSGKIISPVNWTSLFIAVFVGLSLFSLPKPLELTAEAWQMFAIFVGAIIAIILQALPMSGVSILSIALLTGTKTLSIQEALSGIGQPIVWLVVMAFFIAKSFIKTGLGIRIAYLFISKLGKNTLSLAYGMALSDLVLAPAIPSVTARAGGIIYPVLKSLALTFNSTPEKHTERKIGAYLIQCAYHINVVTGAMFLTAMAANPLMADIADGLGVDLNWGKWALAASLPGLISLGCIPLLLYWIYPPQIKHTPDTAKMAQDHLQELGPMKQEEWMTASVFILMLILWMFGPFLSIQSTVAAFIGVSLLLLSNVLTVKDLAKESGAWDTLIWFSTLITMAGFLTSLGVIPWISENIRESLEGLSWLNTFFLLVLIYFFSHYFFASITAHVSSMFTAFVTLGIVSGVPPMLMILSIVFSSNLSASITHYGTGPAPLLFGAGYVTLREWWILGIIIGVTNLIIWIGLGSIWWKILGLY